MSLKKDLYEISSASSKTPRDLLMVYVHKFHTWLLEKCMEKVLRLEKMCKLKKTFFGLKTSAKIKIFYTYSEFLYPHVRFVSLHISQNESRFKR